MRRQKSNRLHLIFFLCFEEYTTELSISCAIVCILQSFIIGKTIFVLNQGRYNSMVKTFPEHNHASDTAVSILKGMNLFEISVKCNNL